MLAGAATVRTPVPAVKPSGTYRWLWSCECVGAPRRTSPTLAIRAASGLVTVKVASIGTGVWECDAGRFHTLFDREGEFIRVVRGRMTCVADDGTTIELVPGDSMTFPPGWSGEWRVHEPLRKIFCGFQLK